MILKINAKSYKNLSNLNNTPKFKWVGCLHQICVQEQGAQVVDAEVADPNALDHATWGRQGAVVIFMGHWGVECLDGRRIVGEYN